MVIDELDFFKSNKEFYKKIKSINNDISKKISNLNNIYEKIFYDLTFEDYEFSGETPKTTDEWKKIGAEIRDGMSPEKVKVKSFKPRGRNHSNFFLLKWKDGKTGIMEALNAGCRIKFYANEHQAQKTFKEVEKAESATGAIWAIHPERRPDSNKNDAAAPRRSGM